MTPYPTYLGLPLPTYQEDKNAQGDYHPHSPMPEPIEQPGVPPTEDWAHNLDGLKLTINYLILGLGGREVVTPFFRFNFKAKMPEIVLT